MTVLPESRRLKKELTLFNVYAIATGATLSSGFFLLPGLAAAYAGPAVVLSYALAAIPLVPAMFSMAELSTAMPRAGGDYYFLDRSMGPLMGTIGGLGTWLVLTLKTAFALVGMGVYVSLLLPGISMIPLAVGFAIAFGLLNLLGVKKTGAFQAFLVVGLLLVLLWFTGSGIPRINLAHFSGFLDCGSSGLFYTAGLVYVSYIGITKIVSVSEEVRNPERNLPLAMFLALVTALVVYGLGTSVMVGVLPPHQLYNNLTPVATTAKTLFGQWGATLMTFAAILAFFSVSNAAILSASRYPLAMGRDHLLPSLFRFLTKYKTPHVAICATVGLIVLSVTVFNPANIAKLASAFQLVLFALSCVAVIIMRESRIESYDPGYRAPFYPWMQLFGIVAPLWFIIEMGWWPIAFTAGLIVSGTVWYFGYAQKRVSRYGAIFHVFARLGERRFVGLDRELRGILKEKGLREEDPFEMVIARAHIIDIPAHATFDDVVRQASAQLSQRLPISREILMKSFLQGTRIGATPVSHGVALPHLRHPGVNHPEMIMVRAQCGVQVDIDDEFLGSHGSIEPVYAFFFLVSPEDSPGQHLRILAQIAGHTDDSRFIKHWRAANNVHEMKQLLLRDERFLHLYLQRDANTAPLIRRRISDLQMPQGTLVALIHRGPDIIIPRGSTILQEEDFLTIIGDPKGIQQLSDEYGDEYDKRLSRKPWN